VVSACAQLSERQVESLEGCESLQKLDLTANFIAAPKGLLSVESLAANAALRELFLVGNPCEHSPAFRPFIIASLPQLAKLDGADVTPSERIAAAQALPRLRAALEAEAAVAASDAEGEEAEGWGPAARLREHREEAAVRSAHEAAKRAEAQRTLLGTGGDSGAHRSRAAPPRQALEAMPLDGSLPPQARARCAPPRRPSLMRSPPPL
jgi:protein TilB